MDFNGTKSIYLQIYDNICERILSGCYAPEERIPSVRELGADIGVNPNTVARSYEKLTSDGIIFNRRGIGYFVSEDAVELILRKEREKFLTDELPLILKRMSLLGIDPSDVLIKNQ